MDTNIGVSAQTSLTNTSTADTNAHNYYIARWVSRKLNQTSIAANTWDYKFAASEQNANANFPRNGAGVLHINCYVWRTSNGTKVGTILNGNSNADFEEAGTTQTLIEGTFSGSAVSSINTNDDVIIFEAWAIVTQGMATAYTQTYFYDGTTESSTTNNAAFIGTPETIAFVTSTDFPRDLSDTVSVGGGTLDRVYAANRSLSDSPGSGETLDRKLDSFRASNDTTTSGEQLDRSGTFSRELSDTVGNTEDVQRSIGFPRELIEAAISIGEDLVRAFTGTRDLSGNTGSGETLDRKLDTFRESSDNTGSTEDLQRSLGYPREITEGAVNSSEDLTRKLDAFRSSDDTTSGGENLTRSGSFSRDLSDTTGSSDLVDRIIGYPREIVEAAVSVGESVVRMFTGNRDLSDTIGTGESVERRIDLSRILSDTVGSSETLQTMIEFFRSLSDTIGTGENLTRVYEGFRSIPQTVASSDLVERAVSLFRGSSDTAPSSEDLSRSLTLNRDSSDTTGVSEDLTKSTALNRQLSDTVTSGGVLSRIVSFFRSLSQAIGISELLEYITTGSQAKTVANTDIPILITDWLKDNWTEDPASTVEFYLIPPKSKITFGRRLDMSAGQHSDVHVHVRNVAQNPKFLDTGYKVEENQDIISLYIEVRYIPNNPPDFSGDMAGAPSDMMWQIRCYINELIRSNPQQLESVGIEIISIMQEVVDDNTPADVHGQSAIEDIYEIVFTLKAFYTLEVDREI